MIQTFIGDLGHLFVVTAFVSAIAVAYSYFQATRFQKLDQADSERKWKVFARTFFFIHSGAILAIVASLFYIIYNHLYEYHYAWSHSSRNLPVYYMISCFWEGQEGSFLLWTFWHVVLGLIIVFTNRFWESSVMTVFALVQAFLCSMILGVVIWELKIGSDPFILMRDAMDIPVFKSNPDFVPLDGRGLNPLLQNYWMVIHPPTLFLGFALTLVPFAFCIAGIWLGRYKEWVRPALPWALVGASILGIGILMGGYWAYETLNFGGYWNWDPVENAVYVPWLVLVASIHTMISFKKSAKALKAAMILTISTFLLILYSTFLTRSGVLGNASVHSFTDLGLSGQLLVYLLFFTFFAIFMLVRVWNKIPTTKEEISVYSREFWIFMGATVLCLAGFQVIMTTSIPVYNKIVEAFGSVSNIALPADQIMHYTKFQVWFAICIAILSGTGQFFWWKKMDRKLFFNVIINPLIVTLLLSSLFIAFGGYSLLLIPKEDDTTWVVFQWLFAVSPFILLTAAIYSISANSIVLVGILRKSDFKLSGGAVAHIGIALMLLGILFSSGYSKVISVNKTGKIYSKDFSTEMNAENVLLWLNEPITMNNYQVTYKGNYLEAKNFPHYIKKNSVTNGNNPFQVVAKEDIIYQEQVYFKRGDSISIYPENTYYEVEYRDKNGKIFTLYPRAQVNPQMGLLASPDIQRFADRDLYTHVSSIPDPTEEKQWSKAEEKTIRLKDTLFLNDYVAVLEKVQAVKNDDLMQLTSNDVAMEAVVKIFVEGGKVYEAKPKFYIKENMIGFIPDVIEDLGIKITLSNIKPNENQGETRFTFSVNTSQKDYVILKAMEKPLINVLWIGTLVMVIGFSIAIYRRYREFILMRDKGMEVSD